MAAEAVDKNPEFSQSSPAFLSREGTEFISNTRSLPLKISALIALLILTARAYLQSITIDEADTFLLYVARPGPSHWDAAANNHVLNSLLIRLVTTVLGVSPFTVRLPALAGALVYIASAYFICNLFSNKLYTRMICFICLVYNPFILDYLVAARGHSLALGFFLCALAVATRAHLLGASENSWLRTCGVCSACLALSFAANFSFAIVCALTLLLIAVAALQPQERAVSQLRIRIVPVLGACILPALGVSLLLSIPTIAKWPRGQLVFGATSLRQTIESVVNASLWRPNPHVLNPWALALMEWLRPFLLPVLGLLCLYSFVIALRNRRHWPSGWRPMWRLLYSLHVLLILTLAAHWTLYRAFGVLLPRERTASYLVPLATLAAFSSTALPFPRKSSRITRTSTLVVLSIIVFYYIGCLRLTYFREWYWNSDSQTIYSILSKYSHNFGVRDIAVSWKCTAALNFYRYMYKDESMDEFQSEAGKYPRGKRVYVIDYPLDSGIVEREGLKIVYWGRLSRIAIAVRPDLLSN